MSGCQSVQNISVARLLWYAADGWNQEDIIRRSRASSQTLTSIQAFFHMAILVSEKLGLTTEGGELARTFWLMLDVVPPNVSLVALVFRCPYCVPIVSLAWL